MSKFLHLMVASAAWLLLGSCGALDPSTSTDEAKTEETVAVGDKIDFSGYVQRAFAITVEGVSFNDTEHFYTRFIPDLIFANETYAESLADAEITVEGEYAMDKFGTSSKVFMSSQVGDGHIYEAITDSSAKFTMKVDVKALDEIFKARVIARIGLLIKYADESTDHFCYILHSIRENIAIDDKTKPIIFDDFKTQLNTYNCSEVKDSGLEIPTATNDPVDDVETTTDEDTGEVVTQPYVAIANKVHLASPLPDDETGSNKLRSAIYDNLNKRLIVAKEKVTNSTDGSEYYPVLEFSNFNDDPAVGSLETTNEEIYHIFRYSEGYLSWRSEYSFPVPLVYADSSGSQDLVDMRAYPKQSAATYYYENDILNIAYPRKSCELNFNTDDVLENCVTPPSSNEFSGVLNSCTLYDEHLYCLSRSSNKIIKYNKLLVEQPKSYTVSKLLMPKTDFDVARIVTFSDSLYFLSLVEDTLVFRQIELKE